MIKETLFLSRECPNGFFIPRAELLSINLIDGMITFKTEKYLYTYSLNKNKLCLVNLKTGNKLSRDFDDAALESEHGAEFERKVLGDLGVDPEGSAPEQLRKNIEDLNIYPEHLLMCSNMEQTKQSEDDV